MDCLAWVIKPPPNLVRRIPGYDCIRLHVISNDRARRDNRSAPNHSTAKDDGAVPDPGVGADSDFLLQSGRSSNPISLPDRYTSRARIVVDATNDADPVGNESPSADRAIALDGTTLSYVDIVFDDELRWGPQDTSDANVDAVTDLHVRPYRVVPIQR
jgi:hypothetical protein